MNEAQSPNQLQSTELHKVLLEYFDQGELQTLCFYLNVDYDALSGEGKANKARELVQYLERRGRINELKIEIIKRRPRIPWTDTPLGSPPEQSQRIDMSNSRQSRKAIIIGAAVAFLFIIAAISDAFGAWEGIKNLFSLSPATIESFDYQVRVERIENENRNEPIRNAEVIIEIGGFAPKNDTTDVNGLARIFIDASRAGKPGRLIINADGYEQYIENIDLTLNSLPDVVLLKPLP